MLSYRSPFGLPSVAGPPGRTVCSRPNCLTVCRTQSSPPYGLPLSPCSFALGPECFRRQRGVRREPSHLPAHSTGRGQCWQGT